MAGAGAVVGVVARTNSSLLLPHCNSSKMLSPSQKC